MTRVVKGAKPLLNTSKSSSSIGFWWLARCAIVLLAMGSAQAGQHCQTAAVMPTHAERAADAAAKLRIALGSSGKEFALIARIGQDLSQHGLVYSHAGFAMKTPDGWRVTHLLNACGSDDGNLFQEGLNEFFSEDPMSYQSKVVLLTPQISEQIRRALAEHQGKPLLQKHYSVIARPYSKNRQNSTAWMLEVIAAAINPLSDTRAEASMVLQSTDYKPDQIHISYGKRIAGGLFRANAVFTDHPISTRLSGNYPVTTVRSIVRYVRDQGWVAKEFAVVPDGQKLIRGD